MSDDYSIFNFESDSVRYKEGYSFNREYYTTVTEYYDLCGRYDFVTKEEITELTIDKEIKDYSDLITLTNLEYLYLYELNLEEKNFNLPSKLEEIYIRKSNLNGTLNFKDCNNLREINITELRGDLTNAVIDIRGMYWLRKFSLDFDTNDASGFELNKCVLMDDYTKVSYSEYEQEETNSKRIYYSYYGNFYYTMEEYIEQTFIEPGYYSAFSDITELYIDGADILDYSGLNKLENLKTLNIENVNLKDLNISGVENLENVNISNCSLQGKLNFSNHNKLSDIKITLNGDLSNAIIDIRNLESLQNFNYEHYNSTGFDLKNCILIDNYNLLDKWEYESEEYGNVEQYSLYRELYNNIDEYLEKYYSENTKEEITELEIWYDVVIKDYSGLSTLTNLTDLSFYYTDLDSIDFEVASKLENLYIYGCTLDGTLDFTGNTNLINIDVNLSGDLSNAIVDIRGLDNLEHFSYEYYTDQASNFNLDRCILRDNTFELTHNSDAESKYESYFYNNYTEEPDEPDYPDYPDYPDDPEYIVSNLNTNQINETTNIIYGFVFNAEGKLTVGDILSRNYFAEGITAKIFKDGSEVTSAEAMVGTGTIIKLYEGEELVEEYTIVIYGDSTGDGKINAVDALAIIKNKNQRVLFENEILEEAGRVTEKSYNEEKVPSAVDALAIIKYSNGNYDIDQRYYW